MIAFDEPSSTAIMTMTRRDNTTVLGISLFLVCLQILQTTHAFTTTGIVISNNNNNNNNGAFLSQQSQQPFLACRHRHHRVSSASSGPLFLRPATFSALAETDDSDTTCRQQRQHPATRRRGRNDNSSSSALRLATINYDDYVKASDLEAIQDLFNRYCDKEGLMTKDAVARIPAIAQPMTDGDLLAPEFDDIWDKAAKFPDVVENAAAGEERIDVDSFVQIYRDIDDLFEDDGDDDEEESNNETVASTPTTQSSQSSAKSLERNGKTQNNVEGASDEGSADDDDDGADGTIEAELESIYETICDKKDRLVGKATLKSWDEVAKLLDEGLLGDDEFDDLWDKTPKSPGSSNPKLDVDGFLSFNVALDGLFDDEDDEEDETDALSEDKAQRSSVVIDDEDLSAKQLFLGLCDENQLVGKGDLKRWGFVQEMLASEDLLQSELDNLFADALRSDHHATKLGETGFIDLYEAIDALFEDDDEDEAGASAAAPVKDTTKNSLLNAISVINSDSERLPCGLEATEREDRYVLDLVNNLERDATNLVRERQGAITEPDLAGTWELIYSTSSAMRFNKGLSGLGGSVPNGKFAGLTQKLQATKFLADVEYTERIEVNPDTASFDVKVTGDWELRGSVSLFTGEPTIVLTIQPGTVTYGPTSTRGDHWKSLGPLNMLDVAYLDDDLRVMRGNTSVDTIFIFRRLS